MVTMIFSGYHNESDGLYSMFVVHKIRLIYKSFYGENRKKLKIFYAKEIPIISFIRQV